MIRIFSRRKLLSTIPKSVVVSLFTLILFALPLFSQSSLVFRSGQDADLLLSGIDFNNSGGPLLFNHPTGIASDGVHFLVADRWNNRVLIWNSLPAANIPPDMVLGQKDFYSNTPGVGRNQLNWAGNVSVSANGKLAIADTENDRVLLWNSFPTKNGSSADIVLNISKFGSQKNYGWLWGVWTDGTKLAAVATHGAAVLIWNSFPTRDDQPPDFFLTNQGFGTPRNITSDGTYFMVSDHNSKDAGSNVAGTFFWKTFPTTATQPNDFYRREWIKGTITPDGKLLAGGMSSIYLWNTLPQTAQENPTITLREPGYANGDGPDIVYAGGRMYVCNYNGNNILVYNSLPTSPTQQADFAIGSPDTKTNTLLTNNFITNAVIASNGKSLFVTSDFDRRMWIWKTIPPKSGIHADVVMNLPEAPWQNALHGDTLVLAGKRAVMIWTSLPMNGENAAIILRDRIGTATLQELVGVAFDGVYFYLTDASGVVWIWKGLPTAQQNPIVTLSVDRASRLSSDGEYFTITRMEKHEVQIYRVRDIENGALQPTKIVSGYPLNLPMHAITFADHLAIANTVNSAVYVWDRIDAAGDYTKCAIIGADSLRDFQPEIAKNKLFWCGTLCFDGKSLWVGEFKFSNRILRFTPSPQTDLSTREIIPTTITLDQNFPNPFGRAISGNPMTCISFSLPHSMSVRLTVCNALGREIRVLVDDYRTAGIHMEWFDGSRFASGVYTYRLKTENATLTRRMVLLK